MNTDVSAESRQACEHLQSKEWCRQFIHAAISKHPVRSSTNPENNEQRFATFWTTALTAAADSSLEAIHQHCESYIEKAFFSSLLIAFIKGDLAWFRILAPPPATVDIESAITDARTTHEACFEWVIIYEALPADARPNSFNAFLRILQPTDPDTFTEEFIARANWESALSWTFNAYFHPQITLQPTFKTFYPDGSDIRPDALLSCTGNQAVKIILECDGFEYHGKHETFIKDRMRDRIFAERGYTVLRYSGSEIKDNVFDVVKTISAKLLQLSLTTPDYCAEWKDTFRKAHRKRLPKSFIGFIRKQNKAAQETEVCL